MFSKSYANEIFTSNLNVGIGTRKPASKFHVEGNTVITGNLGIGTTIPKQRFDIQGGDLIISGNIGIGTTIPLKNIHNEGDLYQKGNVGIGTLTPRGKLDIVNGNLLVNTGFIGIGTTIPRNAIDISGSLNVSGNIGIGSTLPQISLVISSTDAAQLPKGTTSQRPPSSDTGYIRYNTDTGQFEGFGAGNQWGSLGGVKSVVGDTYISAEYTPGNNDKNLHFYTSNVERMLIDPSGTTSNYYNVFIRSNLEVQGSQILRGQLLLPTDKVPFIITSCNLVSNLNVHLLGGQDGGFYRNVDNVNAGVLDVIYGGTGSNYLRSNSVLIGNNIDNVITPIDFVYVKGNVGIGTNNPRSRLTVKGGVIADDFTIDSLYVSNITVSGSYFLNGDNQTIRNNLQLNPLRVVTQVGTENTTIFSGVYQGVYAATPQTTEVYVNGYKYAYYSPDVRDYNVTFEVDEFSQLSTFTVTLEEPAEYGDTVDIVFWPQNIDPNAILKPGYVSQVINLTYWSRDLNNTNNSNVYLDKGNVGIGTYDPVQRLDVRGTAHISGNLGLGTSNPQAKLHVNGNMLIAGNILPSSSNLYSLGSSNYRFKDIYLSGNSIDLGGTIITRDNITGGISITGYSGSTVDFIGKNIYGTGNLGIGTTTPLEKLHVTGNIIQGASTCNIYRNTTIYGCNLIPSADGLINNINITSLYKKLLPSRAIIYETLSSWTSRLNSSYLTSIVWSPELGLFVAISQNETVPGPGIMYSRDGMLWSTPVLPVRATTHKWRSICWSSEIKRFIAVASGGIVSDPLGRVIISDNGVDWFDYNEITTAFTSICWSPERALFVAIGFSSGYLAIQYSIDGTTWTTATVPSLSIPSEQGYITWCAELDMFVAVAGLYIITSRNGYIWDSYQPTIPSPNGFSYFTSISWSPDLHLFVITGYGTGASNNKVIISKDGITWSNISITNGLLSNIWTCSKWIPELAIFILLCGDNNGLYFSYDGVVWDVIPFANGASLRNICWSKELSILVAITDTEILTSTSALPSEKNVIKMLPTQFGVDNYGKLGIGTTIPRELLDIQGGNVIVSGTIGIGTTFARKKVDIQDGDVILSGNVGIGSTIPQLSLVVNASDAIQLPKGTTSQRPPSSDTGYIRYNTDTGQFEGFGAGNQWGSLGGVKSVAGDTYISAEYTPGNNDKSLHFYTSNVERMLIDPSGNTSNYYNVVMRSNLEVRGSQTLRGQLILPTEKAPLVVTSSSLVSNLNVHLLGGQDAGYYRNVDNINDGILDVQYGGTGSNYLRANSLLVGNGQNNVLSPSDLVYINSRIGIGNSQPLEKLHVTGNILATNTIYASNLQVIGDFTIMNTVTSNTEQMIINNAGTGPALKVYQSGNNSVAEFYDTDSGIAVFIGNDGKVGVGTTANYQTLDIIGSQYISSSIGIGTTYNRSKVDVQDGNIVISNGNLGIGTTIPLQSFHVTGKSYLLGNVGIGTSIPKKSLDIDSGDLIVSNGTIGIGTTLPRNKLDLQNGNVSVIGNIGIGTTISRNILDIHNGNASILGNIGIGSILPQVSLVINTNDAVQLPKGTTSQRPPSSSTGYIRYNTDTGQFEGFGAGNQWGSLGGVKSVAGDTYISAEYSPGNDDKSLHFYTSNIERMLIDPSGTTSNFYNVVMRSNLEVRASQTLWGQLILPTEKAPLVVTSSSLVSNLNVHLLGGQDAGYYRNVDSVNAGILNVQYGGTGSNYMRSNAVLIGGGQNAIWSPTDLVYLNGNLGIGTSIPTHQLHVMKDIVGTSISVTSVTTSNFTITGSYFIQNDNQYIRNSLQLNPIRIVKQVTNAYTSNFVGIYNGIYRAEPSATEVYVNGYKMAYYSSSNKDYDVTYYNDTFTNQSFFTVTLEETPKYGDIVDIVVWPQYLNPDGMLQPGYVLQNVNFSYWQRPVNSSNINYVEGSVGVGTTSPRSLFDVEGRILSKTLQTSNILVDTTAFVAGGIGIGTNSTLTKLEVHSQDGILLPRGTTLQRPNASLRGYIRYNTDTNQFEGLGAADQWGSLGGVKSTDQTTYISAESAPGANDGNLRFYNQNNQTMIVTSLGNVGIGNSQPLEKLHVTGNILATNTIYASNLQVVGDFTIMNTVTSNTEQMIINNAGTGPALKVYQSGANSVAEFYDTDSGISLFIGNDGKIGIGTTANYQTLDVIGSQYISSSIGIGTTYNHGKVDVQGGNVIVTNGNLGVGTTIPLQSFHVTQQSTLLGNVGIGTIIPRKQLDVQGDTIVTGNLGVGTTLPSQPFQVNGIAYISGNTGIGSAIPGYKLDVQGNTYIAGPLTVNNTITTNNNNINVGSGTVTATTFSGTATKVSQTLTRGNYLIGNNYDGAAATTWDVDATTSATASKVVARDTSAYIYSSGVGIGTATARQLLDIQGGNAIIIGNIGIGTTVPISPLHVIGTSYLNGNVGIGTFTPLQPFHVTGKAYLETNVGIGTSVPRKLLDIQSGDIIVNSGNVGIGTTIPRNMVDIQGGNMNVIGNVGIGTTISTNTLDVLGKAYISGNLGIGTTIPLKTFDTRGDAYISGKIGVGTLEPIANLHLQYGGGLGSQTLRIGNDNDTYTDQIFSIRWGIDGGMGPYGSGYGAFGVKGIGVHVFGDDEFSVKSSGWNNLFGVKGLTGNVYAKGNVGIGSTNPQVSIVINRTDAIQLPKGTTNQRPSSSTTGYIRYNTDTGQFEGFGAGNQWGSLGGVKSVAGDTYISAEYTPGNDDKSLHFYTSSIERMLIDPSGTTSNFYNVVMRSNLEVRGSQTLRGQLILPSESAPLVVSSSSLVSNLNVHLLGGQDAGYYRNVDSVNAGILDVQYGGTGSNYMRSNAVLIGGGLNAIWSPTDLVYLNGNLGIGTTIPMNRLDVNGGISANSFNVSSLSVSNITVTGSFFTAGDNQTIRNSLQLNALRIVKQVTGPTSNITGVYNGIYKALPHFTEVYVNGYKMAYYSSSNKDYDVTYYHDTVNNQSLFTITLEEAAKYGDIVDIVVWPSYLDPDASLQPGYVLQNLNYTYWRRPDGLSNLYYTEGLVGVGTTTPRTLLDVEGKILSKTLQTSNLLVDTTAFVAGGIGIGTNITLTKLEVHSQDGILLPRGTTLQRPNASLRGYIRYNTDTNQFEGLGAADQWGSLGGVKSTDQTTYISAESAPGANDGNIRFYNQNNQTMIVTSLGNVGIGNSQPLEKLHVTGNILATNTIYASNLQVVGDFTIMNTVTSNTEQMIINNAGTGPALKVYQSGTNSVAEFYDTEYGPALFVGNDGKIGIGTTANYQTLDVIGSQYVSSSIGIGTTYNHGKVDVQGGNVVVTNGNLGVGTTIPLQSFHVTQQSTLLGNVGIGTIIPRKQLDVQGDTIVTGNLGVGTTLPSQTLHVNGIAYISGNTGIGSSIPGYKLDVQGNTYIAGPLTVNNTITTNNNNINVGSGTVTATTFSGTATKVSQTLTRGNYLIGNNYDGAAATTWDVDATTTSIASKVVARDSSAYIYSSGAGIGTATARQLLDVYGGNAIVIGNVGIGTTIPISPLHVLGTSYLNGNVGIGTFTPLQPFHVTGKAYLETNVGIGTSVPRKLLDIQSGDIIVNSGNVGIGTTIPRNMVDIQGGNMNVIGNVGIGSTQPQLSLVITSSDAIQLPKGTTNQRPSSSTTGYIRYNTDTGQFEGFGAGNQWGSLGGVKSVAGDTYISAEYSPGNDDKTLHFYTSSLERVIIDPSGTTSNFYNVVMRSNLEIRGSQTLRGQLILPTELAPLVVTSSSLVSNLNVHLLGGQDAGYYRNVDSVNAGILDVQYGGTGSNYMRSNALLVGGGQNAVWSPTDLIYLNGNLGIGTSIPTNRLDVNGGISANSFSVSSLSVSNITVTGSFFTAGDNQTIRNSLQLNALRIVKQVTGTTSNITGVYNGIYKALPHFTEVYVNGYKMAYYSSSNKDYDVTYSHDTVNNQSLFTVTLEEAAKYGDIVDVVVWPSYLDPDASLQPGYVLQNLNYTYWRRPDGLSNLYYTEGLVGVGTTTPRTLLDVEGKILSKTLQTSNLLVDTTAFVAGGIGIGTNSTLTKLEVHSQDGILLPRGTTLQRPNASLRGYIRYNTDTNQFEGLGAADQWGSLGGVKSTDQTTYISAELTAGANDGNLRFYNQNALNMVITSIGNVGIGNSQPLEKLHVSGNILATNTIYASNLQVIGDFTIMNTITSNTEQMIINNAGTGPALKVYQSGNNSVAEFYDTDSGIALFVGNNGKIGIGTTANYEVLNIIGNEYLSGNLGIGTTISRNTVDIENGNVSINGKIGIGTTIPKQKLDIQIGDIIINNGNIGIGTTIPNYNLHVMGNTYISGNVGIGTTIISTTLDIYGKGANIYMPDEGSISQAIYVADTYIYSVPGYTGVNPAFAFTEATGFVANISSCQSFTVDGSGSYTFVAYYPGAFFGKSVIEYIGTPTITAGFTTHTFTFLFNPGLHNTNFLTIKDSVTTRFIVDSKGNVGIGITNPRTKLEVNGIIYVNGDIISNNSNIKIGSGYISSGNIGIGTSIPRNRFDVIGNSSFIGNIGIGSTSPEVSLVINATDAVQLPKGTTSQRPISSTTGYIRYNTETGQFEGFGAGNQWGSLGGVKSVSGDTYISAEYTPGNNDKSLHFFTSNVERMLIDPFGTTSNYYNVMMHSNLEVRGSQTLCGQLILPTEKSPLIVTSSSLVSNLNVHLLGGQDAGYYRNVDNINDGILDVQYGGTGSNYLRLNSVLIGNQYAGITSPIDFVYINGNVGIGTSIPTSKLTVKGDFTADYFSVSSLSVSNITVSGSYFLAGDNQTVRNYFRLKPLRITEQISTSSKSIYTGTYEGVYQGTSVNTEVYLNGYRLAYYNSSNKDFDVSYEVNTFTNTTLYTVTLVESAKYGDIVDITIYPSYIDETASLQPGYVLQNISVNDTLYWIRNYNTSNIYFNLGNVGIGTTYATTALEVNGNIKAKTLSGDVITDSTSITSSSIAASATAIKTTYDLATTANNTANAALPKAGGTMTGDLKINALLGIGTTTPLQQFHVTGNTYLSGNIGIGTTIPRETVDIQQGDIIVNNGNIGIGTTIPLQQFYVIGNTYLSGNLGIGTTIPRETVDIQLGDIIVNNGNIGIGTTVPLQQFHITGNTYLSGNIGIGTTIPRETVDIQLGDIIVNNGNIGIGTTIPLQQFHVTGNTYLSGNLGIGTTIPRETVDIQQGNIIVNNGSIGIGTIIPRVKLDVQGGNAIVSGSLGVGTTLPQYKMHVQDGHLFVYNGNIGIGSGFTPQRPLHIMSQLDSTFSAVIRLATANTASGDTGIEMLEDTNTNLGAKMTYHTGDNKFYIQTLNLAAPTVCYPFTALRNNGNVGIGSTSPEVMLDVAGQTQVQGKINILSDQNIFGNIGIGTTNPLAALDIKAGNTTTAPLLLRSGTNVSTVTVGALEYDGTTPYFTPGGTFRGIIPSVVYNSLTATKAFANVATVQQIFATNITLVASRTYEFEMVIYKIRTASAGTAVAHTLGVSFTGTATLTSIGYTASVNRVATATTGTATTIFVAAAGNTTVGASFTGLNEYTTITIKGFVRVNAGGTFIPNITYSAAPVTTPTAYADNLQPNCFIKLTQIGTNTSTTMGNTFA